MITDRIKEAVDGGEADPHVIARELLDSLTEEEVHEVALVGLAYTVRKIFERTRNTGVTPDEAGASRRVGRSRWQRDQILSRRYAPAGQWKLLGDLTAEDIETLVIEYEERAAANLAYADKFRSLKLKLAASGALTVSGLADADLQEVFG